MIYLNLISGPRNISTALMYSFAQRPDTVVLDEPYYAVYLLTSDAAHPGKEKIIRSQPHTQQEVEATIFMENSSRQVVFIKNMAHHIEILDGSILEKTTNIFLIRDPKQIIASYARVIERPVMQDIGIAYQWSLFEMLSAKGTRPVVLDSGLLLQNPASVLQQVCQETGIEFDARMLTWEAGPKPYDGVWAPYWYDSVHQSTGFVQPPPRNIALPSHLTSLYEEADSFYKKLLPFAINP